ncbi:MAG: hypothetical protein NVSMB6_25650 [Burkholderiaceae bacterium]
MALLPDRIGLQRTGFSIVMIISPVGIVTVFMHVIRFFAVLMGGQVALALDEFVWIFYH